MNKRKFISLILLAVLFAGAIGAAFTFPASADEVTTNDNNNILVYSGGTDWQYQDNYGTGAAIDGDFHFSSTAGAQVEFTFTGTSVGLISLINVDSGMVDIYIDDVFDATVDLYSSVPHYEVEVYTKDGLTQGTHTIKAVVSADHNAASTDYIVIIDAFKHDDGWDRFHTPTPDPAKLIHLASHGLGYRLSGNSTSVCNIADGEDTDTLICSAEFNEYDPGYPQQDNWELSLDVHSLSGLMPIYYSIVGDVGAPAPGGGTANEWQFVSGWVPFDGSTDGTLNLTAVNPHIEAGVYSNMPNYGPVTGHVIITLSIYPIQKDKCYLRYYSTDTNGPYVIDPTVEFPQGKSGSPSDEQTYTVLSGKTYAVRIGGDKWNDGTRSDRYEAAYSWDNVTWVNLEDITTCLYQEPTGQYFYTAFLDSPETATTLYIRADDLPGQFADNSIPTGEHFVYYVSLEAQVGPDACNYLEMTNAGPFGIVPTVELPLGPTGEPPDYQTYTTVSGAFYGIRTANGAWNDGETSNPRYDAAISWDRINWTPLATASLCSVVDTTDPNYSTYYVQATTTTFFIRVNDKSPLLGAHFFSDNTTVDPDKPFQYYISLVVFIGIPDCSSQFAYDPMADTVASVSLPANTSYTPATNALVPGDWYVIEVANGSWQDGGVPPDLYNAQFSFGDDTGQPGLAAPWYGMDATGTFVYCIKTNGNYTTAYIQAGDSNDLYLRVADLGLSFTNNTGHLGINIYHASYTHRTEGCELKYGLDNFYYHGSVAAQQENGIVIGESVLFGNKSIISNVSTTTTNYQLEPGQWYMLETTGGPWGWVGDTHVEKSYDAAVSDSSGTWLALKDWHYPICNVPIDALGHRRVYFQVPTDAPVNWKIRVNDTSGWSTNYGSIGFDLYKAFDLKVSLPNGKCDYIYDQNHPINGPAPILIDAKQSGGTSILSVLQPNKLYAFVIGGNPYHWTETAGGSPRFDGQISDDNGATWHVLPTDYGGVVCYVQNGNETVMFISTGQHYQYRMRVNSDSFNDNTGSLSVNIYSANAGDTVNTWTSCLDGLSKSVIDPHIWIDVTKSEGQAIPISDSYSNDNTVLGYVVQIENGTGPWHKNDGSSPDDHYDAEISQDNGTTWGQMDDAEYSTQIQCAGIDQIHRYKFVYFKLQPGTDPATPTIWKIRANDDTAANFPGHSGNLGYELFAVTEVNNTPNCLVETNRTDCLPVGVAIGIGANGTDVCTMPNIIPTITLDVGQDVKDVASWATMGILQFMAICPVHIDALLALRNMFNNVEPLATLSELTQLITETQSQLAAYQWYDANDPDDLMATSANGASFTDAVMHKMFPPMTSSNPMNGGKLLPNGLTLSAGDPTHYSYYNSCVANSQDFLGNYLPKGICMISLWWRETGVSLWMQMIFDVMIAGSVIKDIRKQATAMANNMQGLSSIDVNTVVNTIGKVV